MHPDLLLLQVEVLGNKHPQDLVEIADPLEVQGGKIVLAVLIVPTLIMIMIMIIMPTLRQFRIHWALANLPWGKGQR